MRSAGKQRYTYMKIIYVYVWLSICGVYRGNEFTIDIDYKSMAITIDAIKKANWACAFGSDDFLLATRIANAKCLRKYFGSFLVLLKFCLNIHWCLSILFFILWNCRECLRNWLAHCFVMQNFAVWWSEVLSFWHYCRHCCYFKYVCMC